MAISSKQPSKVVFREKSIFKCWHCILVGYQKPSKNSSYFLIFYSAGLPVTATPARGGHIETTGGDLHLLVKVLPRPRPSTIFLTSYPVAWRWWGWWWWWGGGGGGGCGHSNGHRGVACWRRGRGLYDVRQSSDLRGISSDRHLTVVTRGKDLRIQSFFSIQWRVYPGIITWSILREDDNIKYPKYLKYLTCYWWRTHILKDNRT